LRRLKELTPEAIAVRGPVLKVPEDYFFLAAFFLAMTVLRL